ncbi:MAG: FkbM family methyltransferase [Armatimonadota bacterium]
MESDLIIDVGMHNGNDTAYYLHRGYRVVAVEANPTLADAGRARFEKEIAAGRLTLLNVGITASAGTATFWVCESNSEWSAFQQEIAGRNGVPCHPVEVECVTFEQLLQTYGVPYYLKIDIEGHDIHCLRALRPPDLPQYVSVESHSLDYLCLLRTLGYSGFKCLNQDQHNHPSTRPIAMSTASRLKRRLKRLAKRIPLLVGTVRALKRLKASPVPAAGTDGAVLWTFPPGSSGPFGEETPGSWHTVEDVAYNWLHLQQGHPDRSSLDEGWYDFHAKLK